MRIGSELSNTGSLSAHAGPSDADKVHKSAHEFEGMLFSQLWKEAQEGMNDGQEEDGLGLKMDGPLQELGFQAFAGKATDHGGLGIAKMIENSLVKSKTTAGHGLSELQNSVVSADHADKAYLGLSRLPDEKTSVQKISEFH